MPATQPGLYQETACIALSGAAKVTIVVHDGGRNPDWYHIEDQRGWSYHEGNPAGVSLVNILMRALPDLKRRAH